MWRASRAMMRTVLIAFVLFFGSLTLYALYTKATPYRSGALPSLADGDIVFQSINTSQTLAIMFATQSLYSHVGIVKMVNGAPHVIEAVGPVRTVTLDKWVKQGMGDRITIARVEGLTPSQGAAAVKGAEHYLGLPYDFYFLNDDRAIYCSELVHKAFARGANVQVGKEQKVGELYVDNFAVRNVIRQRWIQYPPCKGSKDFESCYTEIMAQPLVSPASLLDGVKVKRIYSNYGILF